jgi:hypothetical protein
MQRQEPHLGFWYDASDDDASSFSNFFHVLLGVTVLDISIGNFRDDL